MSGLFSAMAWPEFVFTHGGEFFTQLSFAAMASLVFSSRATDFLVIKKDEAAETLRSRIQEELEKGVLFDVQNQQYTEARGRVEELVEKINMSRCCIVRNIRIISGVLLVVIFFLLTAGYSVDAGWLPLLAFLPLGCARFALSSKSKSYRNELERVRELFESLQKAYTVMANRATTQADSSVDDALNTEKTGRRRRRKTSSGS